MGFYAEETAAADDEAIEVARNELTEGGFGDDETEETMELDTDLLESFFSGDAKKKRKSTTFCLMVSALMRRQTSLMRLG